jgi:hypothetical protein
MVAKVTSFLMENDWQEKILIFDGSYVETFLYEAHNDGIYWHVVIVSDADEANDKISYGEPVYAAVTAMASLTLAFATFSMYALYRYRTSRMLKLLQPDMISMVLLGALLLGGYCFSLLGANDRSHCVVRPYLFTLSTTLFISPLVVKAAFVYMSCIFQIHESVKFKSFSYFKKTSIALLLSTGLLMTSLVLFAGQDGTIPVTRVQTNSDGNYVEVTICQYQLYDRVMIFQGVYLLVIQLIGALFSYSNRNLPETISGGRVLFAVISIMFIITLLTAISLMFIIDLRFIVLTKTCGVSVAVLIVLTLIFFPAFYKMYAVGDRVAAASIIHKAAEEVLQAHRHSHSPSVHANSKNSNSKNSNSIAVRRRSVEYA